MISITFCKSKSLKKQYIDFVYDLYKDDTSFVGASVFELKTYLYQTSPHAKEVFEDAILVKKKGEIKVACMFFFSNELSTLQIGFFEAREQAQSEVDALLDIASKKAEFLRAKKIVVGLNAHVSIGVGLLNNKSEEGSIAFDSIYSKLYYPDYFRTRKLTESTLTTYRVGSDQALKIMNDRSVYIVL